MDPIIKEILVKRFRESPLAKNLEKFLKLFKTKEGVLNFCLESAAEENRLSAKDRQELADLIKEEIDGMFEKIEHQRKGSEILNKII